jgi:hypothetical protein
MKIFTYVVRLNILHGDGSSKNLISILSFVLLKNLTTKNIPDINEAAKNSKKIP